MGLEPGTRLRDIRVDTVFVGSCTNGRIEDLRAAAAVVKGRKVADGVRMLVVPGSARVRLQAEAEGLDAIFTAAGAEGAPGCSMCLDEPGHLAPGERSASTSNRNLRADRAVADPPRQPARRCCDRCPRHAVEPCRPDSGPAPRRPGGLIMEKFETHTGVGVPLRRSNVDTDQIIPAEYLKRDAHRLRGRPLGRVAPGWGLRPEQSRLRPRLGPRGRTGLGTGSSREHAVWALMDYGFRVVISSRFADIFRGNSGKQGLLTAVVSQDNVELLWKYLENHPGPRSRSTSSRGR